MQRIQQLREIAQSTDLHVDRDGGRIVGVRVLGPESVNGRQYPVDTVTKARGLYEGKQVNTDHPSRHDPNEDRSVQDRIGWLEGVAVDRAGGLTGNLHLLLSHPLTASVMEAAERNPALFGMSHNVEGRTRREGGITIVEEITRVRSVDLVADPASTRSLFESQEKPAMTVKAFFESHFANQPKRLAILREMDDELGEPVMQAEMPAEEPAADASTQMKDAFRSMVMAAFDDESLDTQATIGKIKEIMKAQEKLLAGDEPATEAEGDEEEPKDEEEKVAAAAESLIRPMAAELRKISEQITQLKGRMDVDTPMGGMRENRNGNGDVWTFPKDAKEATSRLIRR